MPTAKPTAKKRYQVAKGLSEQLMGLAPELAGKFQCPTCMGVFNIHFASTDITAAHILPEASGGNRWTLLCRECNSGFGKFQDKWLGEYLNLLLNDGASFLDAKTKSKYIEVNGEKVSGRISVSREGLINILLPTNYGSSDFPMGNLSRIQIKTATVEINGDLEMVTVPESTGTFLYSCNL
jgi:HNH endonuclease